VELLEARSVLAVQPHYDDNDIACAGTLIRLCDSGARVTYVTVTDDLAGVLDTSVDDQEARRRVVAEQRAAGDIVGVSGFEELGWADAAGLHRIALRDQVVDLVRRYRPEVVLTVDPWLRHEAHSDHTITGLAVSEAVILSGLPRFRRSEELAPHDVSAVAYCFTDDPTVVVDTSAVQDRRHAALDCYRAQFTDEGLARLHSGLDRVERSWAPSGATHGERLKVLAPHRLHVGVGG
jgi:LmbE family N-acetylglucosaminyl deacetylase